MYVYVCENGNQNKIMSKYFGSTKRDLKESLRVTCIDSIKMEEQFINTNKNNKEGNSKVNNK